MFKSFLVTLSVAALSLGVAACSSNNGGVADVTLPGHVGSVVPTAQPTGAPTQYTQIELLSRPAVKEVFETFANHQITNAAEPYNDSTLQSSIQGTADFVRPPTTSTDIGKTLASVLYPNVLQIDVSDTTDTANYLALETGGATGGKFGGRDPNNDVVGTSLGALFGNTLVKLGVITEDNEENNCLSTENLPAPRTSQMASATFPYLATPH